MLLIYREEAEREGDADARRSGEVEAKGTLISSALLQPVATATTVRVRDGDTVVSDGPVADTTEALGGYCLIDTDSLDEAIEWAAGLPSARSGTVEIRPVRRHAGHGE